MNRIMIIATVVLGFVGLYAMILKKILGLFTGSDEIIPLHPSKLPLPHMNKEVT